MHRFIAVTILALSVSGLTLSAEDLSLPSMSKGDPGAGMRVRLTAPEYVGSGVYHSLYLPADWSTASVEGGETWPVIVEYTGNYFPAAGSTGEVKDAGLGYGISRGKFIWVVLPFIEPDRSKNAITWWGDETLTANYAKANIPRICEEYGGDPDKVILCGFSRGAIAVNYIGLHDDEIAKLWCGFITHDHYDGVKEWGGTHWGTPLETYQAAATKRLDRIRDRPVLVCRNGSTAATETFLKGRVALKNFTFLSINTGNILGDFPNRWAIHPHNDRWLLKASEEANAVARWVDAITK
ncbi:hypothetical protein VSU19_12075 [Verrucomicrobiales bacterium BCK34]|nr:hypothetical protein [Verrucomicrobiales bacterium BCK34]